MKIAVICINQYLNVHHSIKNLFPDYDLFHCNHSPESIMELYNKIQPIYEQILITAHNICYKKGNSYMMEYKPLDYIGGDYYGVPYASIQELFMKTCDDPIALGYNNKGYIKKEIIKNKLSRNDYLGSEGGIFIYSNRLYGQDNKCNVYLPSCMIDILPKLKLEYVNIIKAEKMFKVAICIDGYLGGWKYTKDSLKNIAPQKENMIYELYLSAYPVIQANSKEQVDRETLMKELSLTGIKINLYDVNETPDSFSLYNKYINIYNTKYDIIVKTKFDTIVDKEIDYNSIQPHLNYESLNNALQIYYVNSKQTEKQSILARTVYYDLDKTFSFVTCMLDIGREKWNVSAKKLSDYIDNLSKLTDNVNYNFYIYVDEKYVEQITNSINRKTNYKLIPVNLKELYTYRYYNKIKSVMNSEFYLSFLKHLGNTKVPEYCIPEYNTLVNCKVDFLYKASLDNTFNSDYFVWIDLFDTSISSYWNPLCIQHPDHVFISTYENIENANRTYLSYFKEFTDVIRTNVFGGSKKVVSLLHEAFYKTLNDCLDKNITHNDRYIMTMCYKNNPQLFKVFSLRNDVLDSNTTSFNYFRLINNYRVCIILKDEESSNFDKPELTRQINNLKTFNCSVDVYERNDTLKSDDLFTYSYVNINTFPEVLDKNILKDSRYDCIILINSFDKNNTIDINTIRDCVKLNTLKLNNNVIYGSYNIMSKAKF